jgi:hypothetical protein
MDDRMNVHGWGAVAKHERRDVEASLREAVDLGVEVTRHSDDGVARPGS